MEEKFLEPIFDRCKSFYKKAKILKDGDILTLKSYRTDILQYNTKSKKIEFLTASEWCFSQTTNRHINEFLKQFTNERGKSRGELIKLASETLKGGAQ